MGIPPKATRRGFLAAAGTMIAGGVAASRPSPVHGQGTPLLSSTRRPVLDDVDVLVVGGGPAGIGAALGATRQGVRTLLIESHSFFGGVAAWALGMPINQMQIHDVPYRAIVPERLDGLLVAGRCISTTHVAAAAGKSMGNCMATGHAAGVAAAMSARQNGMPRELKVAALQEALRADGVSFDLKSRGQEG